MRTLGLNVEDVWSLKMNVDRLINLIFFTCFETDTNSVVVVDGVVLVVVNVVM